MCLASSDPAKTLAELRTIYNVKHLYDVLEILDFKDEVEEIRMLDFKEQKAKEEAQQQHSGKVRR